MKNKLLIGVTGGIGTGKTTFCKIVETLGYAVFYSDVVAKKVIYFPSVKEKLIDLLGKETFLDDVYNVPFVKEKVFASEIHLHELNAIVHPVVKTEFYTWYEMQKSTLCFYESALLYQSSLDVFDFIIEIQSPIEEKIFRVLKRDPNRSRNEVLKIIENQRFECENNKILVVENLEAEFFLKKVLKTVEMLLHFEK